MTNNKTVGISVETLYNTLGEQLTHTNIKTDDGYFDLFENGSIVCMDGEECEILAINDDRIVLLSIDSEDICTFILTQKEFDVAAFSVEGKPKMKAAQLLSTVYDVNYLTSALGESVQLPMLANTQVFNQLVDKFYNDNIEQTELKHYLNYIVDVEDKLYIFATLELDTEQYDINALETLASQINSLTEWNVYYEFECFDNYSEIIIAIPIDTAIETIDNVLKPINKLWLI